MDSFRAYRVHDNGCFGKGRLETVSRLELGRFPADWPIPCRRD